jgi:hypothetical protein
MRRYYLVKSMDIYPGAGINLSRSGFRVIDRKTAIIVIFLHYRTIERQDKKQSLSHSRLVSAFIQKQ